MKLKILMLGNEERTQWVENSLISRNIEVVCLRALPDNMNGLKVEKFNLAIIDDKIEDLRNACFRMIWLGRTRVAVLSGKLQEDREYLLSLGVEAFFSEDSGPDELAAGVAVIAARGSLLFKSVRIMVIEDDQYIREAIRLCFRIFWPEAELNFADDGRSGIDITRSFSPDITLLDLGLPDMTGYDVLERIRIFNQSPVIIISATNDKDKIIKAIQSGASDYIIKPFKQIELIPRLKKYVIS
jgi:CheY-like chemotaxis protein